MYMVQNCLDSALYEEDGKEITLCLENCKKAFVFDFYTCKKKEITDGKLSLNLRAGEAKFIIPYKENE